MKSAAVPANEPERLEHVRALGILDTAPEERFDVITRAAMKEFAVPISTITIVEEKREWYKSCQGVDMTEAPREASFCAHAMLSDHVFIVEDTLKDDRFADNPMVVGKPYIRFYAGVSLYDKAGVPIGVFCIKDTTPRKLSSAEVMTLLQFAARATKELNKQDS
ncbi:MAG: GAF domain-containing protein [Candidatus Kerfeldbacteria bacterium]|nr:GAF domain-containing protein [Candidatus Kerfeldbacteria bacterium]